MKHSTRFFLISALCFIGFLVALCCAYQFHEGNEMIGKFSEDYKVKAFWQFKVTGMVLVTIILGITTIVFFCVGCNHLGL